MKQNSMASQSLSSKITIFHWAQAAVVTGILSTAGGAEAAQLFATDVVYYNNNNTTMESYRTIKENALGSHDLTVDSSNGYKGNQDFLALGVGGRAVFDFGQDFAGNVTLWETTWGSYSNQSAYDEQVDIYYGYFNEVIDWKAVAHDLSQWQYAGDILNIADNAYSTTAGATNAGSAPEGVFNYVLLVDKSAKGNGRDGFDVNAIAVQGVEKKATPEPALLSGLLLIGLVGRRSRGQRQVESRGA